MDFIPKAEVFTIPLPFPIFGQTTFAIYWYGILIVTGALLAAYIASLEAKRRGIDQDHVWNGLLVVLIVGVIGARLYHIVSSPTGTTIGLSYYLENPVEMLNFRAGGLGIYGAVAGGMLGLYFFTRYAKLSFVAFVDMAMMGLPFAQAIGRWGNFFNQELYGYPTTFPWGIPIDAAHRLPIFQDLSKFPVDTTRFHPTFLYESLINLGIGTIILYSTVRWRKSLKPGDLFLMWGLLYGLGRFLVEFQRPDAWMISGIATAQLIGLGLMVVCGVVLMYRHTGPSKAARVQAAARRRQQR